MAKVVSRIDDSWRRYLDSLGANAAFVEGLIRQYLEDPAQVDERWRRTFDAVLADEKANGDRLKGESQLSAPTPAGAQKKAPTLVPKHGPVEGQADRIFPIQGAAAKIAENMEASLSV